MFHNYEDELSITGRRSARLASWIAGASANLFAAHRIRTVVERKLAVSAPNASVLLNPIAFSPPERPVPLPPGPPWRFAVLAALDVSRKAQDVLLRALARPQWRERSYELFLYGSGPDETPLARLVRESGLSDKVRLVGHTSDVLAALSSAHVVLQLTRLDAMPISVMEAMAVGRPVAVTPVGDMPAWVKHGENGWVSSDASPESIAATLEDVWASRGAWAALGERSHRVFQERYTAPAEERLLDDLLALMR
jgi:glycosyltransferase involved in cell wall biosynthesis